jgi:protein subunit release factor B
VLLESDIEEQFARGAGPGGQKINTRSNKVQLTHTPTGITVDCQEFRDLTSNRKRARSILRDKVDFHLHGAKSKLGMRHDKVRKKKSKSAQKARKKYGNVPKTPDVSADACEDESNDNSDGLEEELYDYNESDDDDESDYDGENDSHSPNVTSTVDNKT